MSKLLGAFYTPDALINFMINLLPKYKEGAVVNVLEPSCGDGRFISSLLSHYTSLQLNITGVEIDENVFINVKNRFPSDSVLIHNEDCLFFENNEKYDLIIGNPPYISKKLITESQVNKLREHLLSQGISSVADKNIWTGFISKATSSLNDYGVLAFVLPLEILQVKFSIEIQDFLSKSFECVDIYTFDHLFFDTTAGQDTVILLAYKKTIEKAFIFKMLSGKMKLTLVFFQCEKLQMI